MGLEESLGKASGSPMEEQRVSCFDLPSITPRCQIQKLPPLRDPWKPLNLNKEKQVMDAISEAAMGEVGAFNSQQKAYSLPTFNFLEKSYLLM